MRLTKPLCALFLVLGALLSASASAAHTRFGFYFGVPLYAPAWYYPPPAYYYPPAVMAPPVAPSVYVEQAQPQAADNSWYYCPDSKTYYPYVQQCASAWQRVPARPTSP